MTAIDLVVVEVETFTGARFVFPDMPRAMVKNVLAARALENCSQVVLVNASSATLTVPLHIVKRVCVDGEETMNRAALFELPEAGSP